LDVSYTAARYSTARFRGKAARGAAWARGRARFVVEILMVAVLLHHFANLGTQAALNLIGVSMAGLCLAVAIAIFSIVRIWFGGQTGASQAVAAIFIALLGLAVPLYFLHHIVTLPYLTDIETTPGEPLIFKALNTQRPADANPLKIPDGSNGAVQEEAYPDVVPMVLERAAPEVFSIVQEAVERLGWTIASSEPPGEGGVGRIEATDQTLIMGFTEDVLVQVKGDDTHAVIDARSVSRYGWHDLGRNAERIRALFEEITTALEKGEKTALEQAEPKKEEPATQATRKPSKKVVRKRRRAD
jgi:hypothetical protein